ncbi:hypothetical protein EA473_19780 [Natrarchaeobius chitinivorans]|uniref:Uncharacterized protein n=1 Tax=Natrarchaeobius chitinivorans TaxID=1679083 RepID=A0A3N6LNF2_NATCH|nr:hypothetical protein EA473_19780 [Natrarchaeobius chitinivorans]
MRCDDCTFYVVFEFEAATRKMNQGTVTVCIGIFWMIRICKPVNCEASHMNMIAKDHERGWSLCVRIPPKHRFRWSRQLDRVFWSATLLYDN